MSKIFTTSLSFKKSELNPDNNLLNLRGSGVSLPASLIKDESYLAQFHTAPDWQDKLGLTKSFDFDPSLAVSDVMPKPEDFIEVPFRLITATTVGAGTWKATDFSGAGVLKPSTNMLAGKALYKEHNTQLDNWVGIVKSTKWTRKKTYDGILVPAGIDGVIAVDAKTNPKIARGLLLGNIYSNSVTVEFNWKMSHEYEDEWDFLYMLGTRHEDGTMVRRIATKIINYHESSLVWLGADPFSKAIDQDGKLVNIDVGSIEYKKEVPSIQSKYIKERTFHAVPSLSKNYKALFDSLKEVVPAKSNKMDKLVAQFLLAFGITDKTTLTEAEMVNLLKNVNLSDVGLAAFKKKVTEGLGIADDDGDAVIASLSGQVLIKQTEKTALEAKVTALEADKVTLTDQVAALTPYKAQVTQMISEKRDEVIRLYKLQAGDKANEAVVKLIQEAGDKALDGLMTQYGGNATAKFGGKCNSCGSKDLSFQSSQSSNEGEDDKNDNESVEQYEVTLNDLRNQFGGSSMKIGTNHTEKQN